MTDLERRLVDLLVQMHREIQQQRRDRFVAAVVATRCGQGNVVAHVTIRLPD